MGSQNIASYFSCPDANRRKLGELQEKDCLPIAHQVEENESAVVDRKNCGHNLDPGMENNYMVAEQERVRHGN